MNLDNHHGLNADEQAIVAYSAQLAAPTSALRMRLAASTLASLEELLVMNPNLLRPVRHRAELVQMAGGISTILATLAEALAERDAA